MRIAINSAALAKLSISTIILGPICLGVFATLLNAFGQNPFIEPNPIWYDPTVSFLRTPGLSKAITVTLFTGIMSTVLSVILALSFCAFFIHGKHRSRALFFITPILAAPHAAIAIGLTFLIAPSGWLFRVIGLFFDFRNPPDFFTINDPLGLSLILGLVVKELPFLIFVIASSLTQIPIRRHVCEARALGYDLTISWLKVIVPQIWPLIRLPIFVVLAYSLSNVDMAIVLGPKNPPVLSVMLLRMFVSPDISLMMQASAGALVQLLIVLTVFVCFYFSERTVKIIGKAWICRGCRHSCFSDITLWLARFSIFVLLVAWVSMLLLVLWSFAWHWQWPAVFPQEISTKIWTRSSLGSISLVYNSLLLACAAATFAIVLTIWWCQTEKRERKRSPSLIPTTLCIPLFVPQLAFLFGLNVFFIKTGMNGSLLAVIWAHLMYVFPYVFIVLTNPWHSLEPRIIKSASALGAGPLKQLFIIKIPILLPLIFSAIAIGMAVSIAQFLPTLFMGEGRLSTLTTEALALSSGSDRRVLGVLASLQALIPWIVYLMAYFIPLFIFRNRRGLSGAV